jgi:hypothetical protein
MTMKLYITYGATTLDLQADGFRVMNGYYPVSAAATDQVVGESFDLWISSSNPSAKITELERAFEYAREHADRPDCAWINFAIDQVVDVYRARLLGGLAPLDAKMLRNWRAERARLHVTIERGGYWEGPEAAIELSNTSGSGTAGITVTNTLDATHENYVEIADDQIAGNLPTPLRLQITNSYNNVITLGPVWVGHNVSSDPENLNPVLEAEDATGGTPTANATCSGGDYNAFTLETDGEVLMYTWTLSAGLLEACGGRYFKTMLRFFSGSVTSVWFRPYIYYGSVVPLWRGPLVRFDSAYARYMRDLAVIQLPPWLDAVEDLDGLTLRLYGKRVTAVDTIINLDYLYLLPVESFRLFEVNGAIAYQSAIVDDGPKGQVYSQNAAGAARKANVVAYGSPIMAHPGKVQRLYFLCHSDAANTAEIARTLSIKAWYRPRRLSA